MSPWCKGKPTVAGLLIGGDPLKTRAGVWSRKPMSGDSTRNRWERKFTSQSLKHHDQVQHQGVICHETFTPRCNDWRQNLKYNPDGSVDLYLQKDSPGADKESNCLPAPAGKFILIMRLYWPNENDPSILDGIWKIPPVTKAN
jgi:hypothetical protein